MKATSATTTSKTKSIPKRILTWIKDRVKCKYWWLDQLNDVIGLIGVIFLITGAAPKWVGIGLIVVFAISTMAYKDKIKEEIEKTK